MTVNDDYFDSLSGLSLIIIIIIIIIMIMIVFSTFLQHKLNYKAGH